MSSESDASTARLIDGSEPASPETLLDLLNTLGIAHRTFKHAPVFTVEEARAIRGPMNGGHSKNLFLRNKKGAMWLVTCEESRRLSLDSLAEQLSAKRFSFASRERLMSYLGVTPGAVTPFAVMNDGLGKVTVVVDQSLVSLETVNFHPLANTMTTSISGPDLLRFLQAVGHEPILKRFD